MFDLTDGTGVPSAPGSSWKHLTDAQLHYLLGLTWDCGRMYERRRIAEAAVELERCWVDRERPTAAARIRERISDMEQYARAGYRKLGKPEDYEYRGGPVDFATGGPLTRRAAA